MLEHSIWSILNLCSYAVVIAAEWTVFCLFSSENQGFFICFENHNINDNKYK